MNMRIHRTFLPPPLPSLTPLRLETMNQCDMLVCVENRTGCVEAVIVALYVCLKLDLFVVCAYFVAFGACYTLYSVFK